MKISGIISPSALAIALVCFCFTFCDLKCNEQKLASLSGFDFIIGKKVNMEGMLGLTDYKNKLKDIWNDKSNDENSTTYQDDDIDTKLTADARIEKPKPKFDRIKPNPVAIIAFVFAIAGIVIAFVTKEKLRAWLGFSLSVTGGVCLLLLKLMIENKLSEKLSGTEFAMNMFMRFEFQFQPAYYIALLCYAVSAGAFLYFMKEEEQKEIVLVPPSNNFKEPPTRITASGIEV